MPPPDNPLPSAPTDPRLDRLFRPRSVAFFGASADPRSFGGMGLRIMKQTGFTGTIYPINPKYEKIEDWTCYPDLDAVPTTPDVVLILIPAEKVIDALRACASKGVTAAVVMSGGFEEAGGRADLATELAAIARGNNIALVGPNCQGIWSIRDHVMLTFSGAARRFERLHHGPVALISQSGNFAGTIGSWLQSSGFGCSYVVSSGNETILGAVDYLAWLVEQDDVRLVILCLEGLRDGAALLTIAARARARGIDIVALKTGKSSVGQAAAASHTGKIGSPHAIYRDIFDQAGILQVRTLTEIFEITEALLTLKTPRHAGPQGGVSVPSNSGGACSLLADLFEDNNVPLATLRPETIAKLRELLPRYGFAGNPADLSTVSYPTQYENIIRAMAADPGAEALVLQMPSSGQRVVEDNGHLMQAVAQEFDLPTIVSFSGDELAADKRQRFRDAGLVVTRDPGETARILGWLYQRREIANRPPPARASSAAPHLHGTAWPDMTEFLAASGITVPPWRIVPGTEQTISDLRFPVAVKALPADADHKTELGLVLLSIDSTDRLADAIRLIRERLGKPTAEVLVQEMVAGGVEVVLSVIRSADFGPVLAIGSGGVAIELYRDIGYLALPTDEQEVTRLLRRLKLWTLLQGFRGKPKADIAALATAATRLALAAAANPEITELEINPLFVLPEGQGVVAVDALIRTAAKEA